MRRVLYVVGGLIVLVASLALLAGGLLGAFFFGPDGRYEGRSGELTKLGRAVVVPAELLDEPVPDWLEITSLSVSAEARDPARPVFLGLGPADEVERYLAGVGLDLATDVGLSPFEVQAVAVPGEAVPGPPGDQRLWVARASGPGQQVLQWDSVPGRYLLVVMNADAGAPVDAAVQVGLEISWIFPVSLVAMVLAVVAFFVALTMLSSSGRPTRVTVPRLPPPPPLPKPLGGSAGPTP